MIRDAVQKENAELRTNRDTLLSEISSVKQKSESENQSINQEFARKYDEMNNQILTANQKNQNLKTELEGLKRTLNDNQIVHQRNQGLRSELENLKRKLTTSTPAKVVPNSRIQIEKAPAGLTVVKPTEKDFKVGLSSTQAEQSKELAFNLPVTQALPSRLEITRAIPSKTQSAQMTRPTPSKVRNRENDDEDPDDPDPVNESTTTTNTFKAKVIFMANAIVIEIVIVSFFVCANKL